jgi:hypothetical protein
VLPGVGHREHHLSADTTFWNRLAVDQDLAFSSVMIELNIAVAIGAALAPLDDAPACVDSNTFNGQPSLRKTCTVMVIHLSLK